MSRTRDWQPLDGADPTPGDPEKVKAASIKYNRMALDIDKQIKDLARLADSGTLKGAYVASLTTAAKRLEGDFTKLAERYRMVGGELLDWSRKLGVFQDRAEGLHRKAVTAQGEMFDNRAIPQMSAPDAPPPPDAEVAAAKAKQGRHDDASGDMKRVQDELRELKEERDRVAYDIAISIWNKVDEYKDSIWQDFKGWMDDHHDLVEKFCTVMGVIAMVALVVCMFVPGLNVVVAIGVAATAASLVGRTMLASTGHGSWVDVALDAFALATFGVGKLLAPGIKAGMAATKTAGAAAKANAARTTVKSMGRRAILGFGKKGARNSMKKKITPEMAEKLRASGQKATKAGEDASKEYLERIAAKPKWLEKLRHGDADLAVKSKEISEFARDFAKNSDVGVLAAKAITRNSRRVGAQWAGNATSTWSVGTDTLSWKNKIQGREANAYDQWKDKYKTIAWGDEPGSEELRQARRSEHASKSGH
jgi:hypothetical protein